MRYFRNVVDYKTRPLFRKGTWKQEAIVLAANDEMENLLLLREECEKRYRRRLYTIRYTEELTPAARREREGAVRE
jgi:hypothetical protein